MTCPSLAPRVVSVADLAAEGVQSVHEVVNGVRARLEGDDATAQFARFVVVGGLASLLYAVLFLLLEPAGNQVANLAGAIGSTMLANELHRRRTFRADQPVGWVAAQWAGGGLAAAGLVATSLALAALDAAGAAGSGVTELALIAAVTGAVGLVRFATLRWAFGARSPSRG